MDSQGKYGNFGLLMNIVGLKINKSLHYTAFSFDFSDFFDSAMDSQGKYGNFKLLMSIVG